MLFHFYCFYIIILALEACDINIFHMYMCGCFYLDMLMVGAWLSNKLPCYIISKTIYSILVKRFVSLLPSHTGVDERFPYFHT